MSLIRRLLYAPGAAVGLCSTCIWGTVRKGFWEREAETFCRLVGPNSRVPFAVRECTCYSDRRAAVNPSASEVRRYGFVTEIKLEDGSQVRVAPAVEPERSSE
jgi:hypothetical protein